MAREKTLIHAFTLRLADYHESIVAEVRLTLGVDRNEAIRQVLEAAGRLGVARVLSLPVLEEPIPGDRLLFTDEPASS